MAMDNKRNTIGDLDRVLSELDGLMGMEALTEEPKVTTLPRASVSQEKKTSPGPAPPLLTSPKPPPPLSPTGFVAPNAVRPIRPGGAAPTAPVAPPRRVYIRPTLSSSSTDQPMPQPGRSDSPRRSVTRVQSLNRQSETYDYVIEEMDRHFSSKNLSFGEGEYVDMDREVFVAEDYVDMDSIPSTPTTPKNAMLPAMPTRLEQLPRLSLDSRTVNSGEVLQDPAMIRLKTQTEPRRRTDPCISTVEDKMNFLRETSRKMSEQSTVQKAIINFYNEDQSYKTIVVDENMTAKDVCEILIMKNRVSRRLTWQIVECLNDDKLERALEDHEPVLQVYENWPMQKSNVFNFRDNKSKYLFFQNPLDYIPDHMLEKSEKENSSRSAREKISEAREAFAREMAFSTNRFMELEGLLWIKESGKKWKQAFSFMRTSGLYYSTKGNSKEPKHLQCLVDFSTVNIYVCPDLSTTKKVFKAPTDFLVVFKKINEQEEPRNMVCICTRNSKNHKCFEQCLRLSKFGIDRLRENFDSACIKHEKMRQLKAGAEMKKKKKKLDDSIGRELESLQNESWYFGELSREMASEYMLKDREDGTFLVRTTNDEIYLTMFKGEKIHHFLIQAMEVELSPRFTLEEGLRNFSSLSSLVEHYKSDSGSLPSRLTRPPSRKLTRYPM